MCVMAAYNSFVKRLSKTKRFKRGKKIIKVFWNCAFVMAILKTIFLDVKTKKFNSGTAEARGLKV